MGTPLVSVIVPVYNQSAYLKRCLTSLQHQTYSTFQVILIDDASTDESAAIIKQVVAEDSRFEAVYLPKNQGVSAARNAGLAKVRGAYLGFVDSDDWVAPTYLAHLVDAMADCQLVATPFVEVRGGKVHTAKPRANRKLTRRQLIRQVLQPVGYVRGYLWNKLFCASIVQQHHLQFDEELVLMEDELFVVHYAQLISKIQYVDYADYHRIVHSASATVTHAWWQALPQQFQALRKIWALRNLGKGQPVDQYIERNEG